MPKLKVFRTTSGFHDSYVAVPSRAAALSAWGANTDLFAMGAAEQVTDTKLMAEPLANPGTVLKRSRGTAGEHLSATRSSGAKPKKGTAKPAKDRKAVPPPSRVRLDAANRRLAEAEKKFEEARAALDREAERLNEKRRDLREKREAEIERQRIKRDQTEAAYRKTVKAWQNSSS